jgi:hypothetical protein
MAQVSSAQVTTNSTTAVLLATAGTSGSRVTIHNNNATSIYLGASTVTASTGVAIDEGHGPIEFNLPAGAKLYGISFSGTPVAQVLTIQAD